MLRKTSFAVLLMVLAGSPAVAQQWAQKMFTETERDFGSVARSAKAEYAFVLSNIYMEDVHISGVRSSCSCTTPRIAKQWLKTYEKGAIIASINTPSFRGSKRATLTVTFDKPHYAEVQLHVSVYIRDDVALKPGSVQFGSVDEGIAADQQVAVSCTGRSGWKIREARSANPHVTADIVETARRGGHVTYNLKVHLDGDAPAGYLNEHLMLVTNDRRNPQVPVTVEGRVVPAVTVSPASLFMGVVEPGRKVTKKLVVRGKRPFRILAITCDDKSFEFDVSVRDAAAKPLHVVPVTFAASGDSGRVRKTIRIETDLGAMAPELSAYAVVSTP